LENFLKKGVFTMENLEEMIKENDQTNENNSVFNTSFQPQSEDQLIEFAKWLKSREHHSIIKSRWTLGQKINDSGGTVYGEDTAGRIAEEVGYSKSTIIKSRKFARMYSASQVSTLLNGFFSLSWRDIAQNLSVPTDDFLRAYEEADTLGEFRNAVTELRPEGTAQRRPRQPRLTRTELESRNTELQNRVTELESENDELKRRIKELQRQLEAAEADIIDVIKDPEPANELLN
jgi:hypothetical protein